MFTNLQSHCWARFVFLDSSAGLAKGQKISPIALTLTLKNDLTKKSRLTCRLLSKQVRFDFIANRSSVDQNGFLYLKLITQEVICHGKIFNWQRAAARQQTCEETSFKDAGSNLTKTKHDTTRLRAKISFYE